MAFDSVGYNGTFTEIAAAKLSNVYKQPCVLGNGFAYTGNVAGVDRTIRLSAGIACGWSIYAEESATTDVAFDSVSDDGPGPGHGFRYDTVAIRYDATSNETSIVVVEGGTAATVADDLEDTPGTTVDDPIYLVRLAAGEALPVSIVDLREFHSYDGIRRFASTAGRDLKVTNPVAGQDVFVSGLGVTTYNGSAWVTEPRYITRGGSAFVNVPAGQTFSTSGAVTHNCGGAPTTVQATAVGSENGVWSATVINVGPTTFAIRVRNVNGTTFTDATAVNVFWSASKPR